MELSLGHGLKQHNHGFESLGLGSNLHVRRFDDLHHKLELHDNALTISDYGPISKTINSSFLHLWPWLLWKRYKLDGNFSFDMRIICKVRQLEGQGIRWERRIVMLLLRGKKRNKSERRGWGGGERCAFPIQFVSPTPHHNLKKIGSVLDAPRNLIINNI